jgi:hypothetical protein
MAGTIAAGARDVAADVVGAAGAGSRAEVKVARNGLLGGEDVVVADSGLAVEDVEAAALAVGGARVCI